MSATQRTTRTALDTWEWHEPAARYGSQNTTARPEIADGCRRYASVLGLVVVVLSALTMLSLLADRPLSRSQCGGRLDD